MFAAYGKAMTDACVTFISQAASTNGLAKKLGLAIAGVDLLQSKRGPLVMEVNSSPGLEGIEGATGVDIASKIIEYVERNEFNKPGE